MMATGQKKHFLCPLFGEILPQAQEHSGHWEEQGYKHLDSTHCSSISTSEINPLVILSPENAVLLEQKIQCQPSQSKISRKEQNAEKKPRPRAIAGLCIDLGTSPWI